LNSTTQNRALTAPILWCLISALLFGASTPAAKHLLTQDFDPLTLAGLLYLGAGLFSLPFALKGGNAERQRSPANRKRLLGAVIFGGVLGPIALLFGLRSVSAGSASLLLNLETTATALLAWIYFKEVLGTRGWIANLGVVLAGVLLVAPDGFSMAPAAGLILFACFCWGLDNNLTAVIDGYTPSQITLAKGLVAGGLNLSMGLAFEAPTFAIEATAIALAVGALAYGASTILYVRGAQQLGAARSQMIFASAPFFGLTLAWGWLGEPVLTIQLVAAGIMAVALLLLIGSDHSHTHRHRALTHTHAHRHDDGHHVEHDHADLEQEGWHTHEHSHKALEHEHEHLSDLHHRHAHDEE
jgi:drug/metabolite transporter (DMT)-like permease